MLGNPGRVKALILLLHCCAKCVHWDSACCSGMRQCCRLSCVKQRTITASENCNALMKADLLILDEQSYLYFNRHQPELLLKAIVY